jgi:hypothetical protein
VLVDAIRQEDLIVVLLDPQNLAVERSSSESLLETPRL